jgi:hypothetical protein
MPLELNAVQPSSYPGRSSPAGVLQMRSGSRTWKADQQRPRPALKAATETLRRATELQKRGLISDSEVQKLIEKSKTQGRMIAGRPVVATSFSMDTGETVVVGTSRVQGDKALILLLTAVPPGK